MNDNSYFRFAAENYGKSPKNEFRTEDIQLTYLIFANLVTNIRTYVHMYALHATIFFKT